MSFVNTKCWMGIALWGLTLFAGFFPFRQKIKKLTADFALAEVFSCGIFLGVGLLHLLADAWRGFGDNGYWPVYAVVVSLLISLLLLGFQQLQQRYTQRTEISVWLIACMLSVHAFFEGAALGLGVPLAVIYLLFVAIVVHKWAESFALAVIINKNKTASHFGNMALFFLFSLMTPVGIVCGAGVLSNNTISYHWLQPLCDAIAAGTFIYFGVAHSLQHLVGRCRHVHSIGRSLRYWAAGFCLMGLVSFWI